MNGNRTIGRVAVSSSWSDGSFDVLRERSRVARLVGAFDKTERYVLDSRSSNRLVEVGAEVRRKVVHALAVITKPQAYGLLL